MLATYVHFLLLVPEKAKVARAGRAELTELNRAVPKLPARLSRATMRALEMAVMM